MYLYNALHVSPVILVRSGRLLVPPTPSIESAGQVYAQVSCRSLCASGQRPKRVAVPTSSPASVWTGTARLFKRCARAELQPSITDKVNIAAATPDIEWRLQHARCYKNASMTAMWVFVQMAGTLGVAGLHVMPISSPGCRIASDLLRKGVL